MLATVVAPLYSKAVPGARLKSATREFAISLREARSRAISTGTPVDLRLVAAPPSYAVGSTPPVQLPHGIIIAAYDYLADPQQSLVDSDALSGEEIAIHFFPDGSSNGAVIEVANSSTAYRVDVSWLTGDIQISEAGDHER